MKRREFLKMSAAGAVGTSLLAVPRGTWAQGPIKIGMPAALSGSNAQYGIQAKRAAELFARDVKAKGILGRPVEFIFEDTAGDPATAVRKAQKLVEKDGVKFLTGVALSSEALAGVGQVPRVESDLHVDDQRGGLADDEVVPSVLLPGEHERPHGRARRQPVPGRGADEALLRAGQRLRLGPRQRRVLHVADHGRQERGRRHRLLARRHQGLRELHRQDPPVEGGGRLPRRWPARTPPSISGRRTSSASAARCGRSWRSSSSRT